MNNPPKYISLAAAMLALSACSTMELTGIQDMSALEDLRPPDAEPGACYGREVAPAVIETITEQVVVKPATYDDSGAVLTPTSYRTDTVQRIVSDRENIWFKTPCADQKVDDFAASVQRALRVRGLYAGRITGQFDWATHRAIRKYQAPRGLDSGQLSLASARALGLSKIDRPEPKEKKN